MINRKGKKLVGIKENTFNRKIPEYSRYRNGKPLELSPQVSENYRGIL